MLNQKVDPRILKEFAESDRQHEIIDAVISAGSASKAAKVLGINRRSVDKTVTRLEGKAASKGVAPHRDLTHQTAAGFETKRVSTAYKEDGSVALQWHIQEPQKQSLKERLGLMIDGIKDDLSGFKSRSKSLPQKVDC